MQELRPYSPSWRDNVAAWLMGSGAASPERRAFVGGLLGSTGLGNSGVGLVDATPVGGLLSMQEATQQGDKGGMALAAAGMLPGAGVTEKVAAEVAERAAPAAEKFITAYHGSPHSFDKFDLSKIGTGEGAQAYGHGLYFAENEEVARAYRNALAKHGELKTNDGRVFNANDLPYSSPEQIAANIWIQTTNLADAKFKLGNYNPKYLGAPKEDILRELEALHNAGARPNGNMYQVRINADPEHFLDWDKPLSAQPKKVQELLGYNPRDFEGEEALAERARASGVPIHKMPGYADLEAKMDAAGALDRSYPAGGNIYESSRLVSGDYRDPAAASQALKEAGIPGIKYLDGGSRAAGDGSRNYVVFDDNLIDILKKYGLVGLLGGGGASFAPSNQQSQPVPLL